MIKLKNPIPRERELPYTDFSYPIIETDYLSIPNNLPTKPFVDVMENRHTCREFGELPREELSSLLWLSSRTRERKRENSNYIWQHRNVPSAGGRHPIDILVQEMGIDENLLWLYNPLSHSISRLEFRNSDLQLLLDITNDLVPISNSTILWFVAQFGRTASKYRNCESLLWRDSGALLATIYLNAEYLNLNCCGLGITGDPWISRALSGDKFLSCVGGCVLGKKL